LLVFGLAPVRFGVSGQRPQEQVGTSKGPVSSATRWATSPRPSAGVASPESAAGKEGRKLLVAKARTWQIIGNPHTTDRQSLLCCFVFCLFFFNILKSCVVGGRQAFERDPVDGHEQRKLVC
jgi:hypothetical protein